MNDYLPGETAIWQRIEGTLKNVLGSYGYSEIRLPIVEQTPLFKRAIGEVTDVVPVNMASIFMPKEAASQPPKMAKPAPRNPQAGILIHKIPVNMKGQKVPGI